MSGPKREIEVALRDSRDEGGCNGCTCYTEIDGPIYHPVWVINLRVCSVRVCRACREELLAKLGANESEVDRLRAALAELVRLKDTRPPDYEQRKPLAWQAAREALGLTSAPEVDQS